jgi:myo-inositol 2-dehydrogenase/D-chiro-inositol 1-dehydrogenase
MRIGLVGLGRIGAFHAATLSSFPSVGSLVVTDYLPERTREVAGRYAAEGVDSVDELVAAGVDGVVIAASTNMHSELIRACVRAGLPTLCEKPVASTGAEGAALLRWLADYDDVPVMMGFPRRHDAAIAAVKAAADSGELGWLTTVRSTTMDPAPPPAEYVAVSGGIFHDCAVHDFDTVRWIAGQEAVEVYATGSNRGAAFFREYGDVDTSAAVITFADGTLGVVSNTRYNGRGYDVRLEVHGSADSIAAGIDPKWPIRSAEPGSTFPAGQPHSFFMDRFGQAFRTELETFLDVVAGKQPSPCTVADGLEADWIAEACTRSVAEHRPVTIDEVRLREGPQ